MERFSQPGAKASENVELDPEGVGVVVGRSHDNSYLHLHSMQFTSEEEASLLELRVEHIVKTCRNNSDFSFVWLASAMGSPPKHALQWLRSWMTWKHGIYIYNLPDFSIEVSTTNTIFPVLEQGFRSKWTTAQKISVARLLLIFDIQTLFAHIGRNTSKVVRYTTCRTVNFMLCTQMSVSFCSRWRIMQEHVLHQSRRSISDSLKS